MQIPRTVMGVGVILIVAATTSAQGGQQAADSPATSRIAILDGMQELDLPADTIVWAGSPEEADQWRGILEIMTPLVGGEQIGDLLDTRGRESIDPRVLALPVWIIYDCLRRDPCIIDDVRRLPSAVTEWLCPYRTITLQTTGGGYVRVEVSDVRSWVPVSEAETRIERRSGEVVEIAEGLDQVTAKLNCQ